jgi:hypothetical protein
VVVSVVVLCCVLRKLMCDLRWCVYVLFALLCDLR